MKIIKVIIGIIFIAFGCAQTAVGAGIFFTASEATASPLEALLFGGVAIVIAMVIFGNAFKGQG